MKCKKNESGNKMLDIVFQRIISNLDIENNIGLDGKTGMVLFLYNYSRLMNSQKAQDAADSIIDEVWESLNQINHLSKFFFTGHSGIAWAMSILGKTQFLDIGKTVKTYLESVDYYIFREQKSMTPALVDVESGLFTSGIYFLSRCELPSLALAGNCNLRENAIYLVEDSERILYRKTSYNNLFLPKQTLSLLNSLLYFLINVHKQKIYPHKTNMLIKYVYEQIQLSIKHSNVSDIMVSQVLLSTINVEIPFCDMAMIDEHKYRLWEKENNLLEILAESGLNTLIYNNKSIFEEVYLITVKDRPKHINYLYHELEKNTEISLKTLLKIAHGLLAISDK